jgi:ATP adenylyltransferase
LALEKKQQFLIPTFEKFSEHNGILYSFRVKQQSNENKPSQVVKPNSYETRKDDLESFHQDMLIEDWDIHEKYWLVLNKFCISNTHILIVTKEFESQTESLNVGDMENFYKIVNDMDDGLGFFNCGRNAGSSQLHKHMQVLSLPPFERGVMEIIKNRAMNHEEFFHVDQFNFVHACFSLRDGVSKEELHQIYNSCLFTIGINNSDMNDSRMSSDTAHSLLLTKNWMMVVPRSKDTVAGLNLNSMLYSGSFYVTSESIIEKIKESPGYMNMLVEAGFPILNKQNNQ